MARLVLRVFFIYLGEVTQMSLLYLTFKQAALSRLFWHRRLEVSLTEILETAL